MILGKKTRLRAIEREDIPTFVRWFNDPEVRQYLEMYLPMSRAEEEQWFESYESVTSIEATLSLVAIISLMAWLSRSVDNTPALGGGIARRGPRWAIGAWFIPLVNIVMPALILRDLARRVSVDGTGRDWLILSWWLIYWAPVLLDIYLLFVPIGGTDSIRELYAFIAAIGVINAAGYIMTIVVMRRLQHDAEHWAGRMQEGWA